MVTMLEFFSNCKITLHKIYHFSHFSGVQLVVPLHCVTNLTNLFILQKLKLYLTTYFSFPQPFVVIIQLCICMNFTILDITCK